MSEPGRVGLHTLPDGRVLEHWEVGDPDGRLVLEHPGTPMTFVFAPRRHEIARERGVRLVAVNRPGYGRSTPSRVSLSGTGQDTADLARALAGDAGYAVVGVSGGGPYAVATAAVDPASVRAVGVVGGVGPWTVLDEPKESTAPDRALHASIGADGPDAVRPAYRALAEEELGVLRAQDDDGRVEAFLGGMPGQLPQDPAFRQVWAVNLRSVLDGPHGLEGYVADNLSWGSTWDIDPAAVSAPALLWYGDADTVCPVSHGEWYASRIPGARLHVLADQDHLEVCETNWPLVLDELLAASPV